MGPIDSCLPLGRGCSARRRSGSRSPRSSAATATPGARSGASSTPTIRAALADWAPTAADEGVTLGIENHQDFTSRELVALLRRGRPRRRHHLRHRQHVPGRRGAARLHARDRAACRGTSTSRTTACSSPTRATAWSAAPSATAPCRSARWSAILAEHHDDADRRARAGRAGGAARAALHARLVERLRAEDRAESSPPACSAAQVQPAARRRRLPHAVGARGRRRARSLRARHDPAQRREHAGARHHANGEISDEHGQGTRAARSPSSPARAAASAASWPNAWPSSAPTSRSTTSTGPQPSKYGEFEDLGEVAEGDRAARRRGSPRSPATSATATAVARDEGRDRGRSSAR